MQLRQQVAEGGRLFALTHAQHVIVWGLHLVVWHDDAANATLTRFNRTYRCTFFVKQVRGNGHRHNSVNLFGVLFQRFFFNQTQNGEGQRFVITYGTGAGAARTNVMAGLAERRAQTLTGHLQQAKA